MTNKRTQPLLGLPRPSEAQIHEAVFSWLDNVVAGHEQGTGFIFHTPNGEYRPKGTAVKLAGMGVRAGVPDILWPWPRFTTRGHFQGLALELKRAKGTPTPEQDTWLRHYAASGWRATCMASDDWRCAALLICHYAGWIPERYGIIEQDIRMPAPWHVY